MYRWELDEPVEGELAGLGKAVRKVLAEFMGVVVIVDPAEYQRRPSEPTGALRTLPFGHHGQGLVTFLIYPPTISFSWSRSSGSASDTRKQGSFWTRLNHNQTTPARGTDQVGRHPEHTRSRHTALPL